MNALPASFAATVEDASCQQLCAMEKTIVLTGMTKTIAVSWLILIKVSRLRVRVTFSGQKLF